MFENQEVEFPVEWQFRIMCDSQVDVTDDLVAVLKSFGVNKFPKTANKSSGGKYLSYAIKVTFHDKASMDLMATQLSQINGVKMVL
jgi:putative lipoic acid-binding regulatory protein